VLCKSKKKNSDDEIAGIAMKKRIFINIFVVLSLIILVLVLIKIGMVGRVLDAISDSLNPDQQISGEFDNYPEYIYETFVDSEGDEISVKMEKKIGTLDGEEVVFYEDTIGTEVIYYNFYKGFIKEVDNEKMVFTVQEECLNADPEDSFYEYIEVEEYERVYYFSDYINKNINGVLENTVFINTQAIEYPSDLIPFIGKKIRLQDSKFNDWLTKSEYTCLDLYIN